MAGKRLGERFDLASCTSTIHSSSAIRSRLGVSAAALQLADEGHPVLLDGKTPLGGNGLSYATTDTAAIVAWWQRWPTANIGLRCDGSG